MFKSITSKIQRDRDYPERQFNIDVLTRVLKGKLYDHLEHAFNEEKKDGIDEYIPVRNRRPSVRYGLCRIVVDDSVSLLFSEGRFPALDCKDEKTRDSLAELVKDIKLNQVMIEAATIGSVGSVAILMRILSNRVFLSVFNTQFLTPAWKKDAPDTLEKVVEKYKVKGSILAGIGYTIPPDDLISDFWFMRSWDENAETWYMPWKVSKDAKPDDQQIEDTGNSVKHKLGFVPMVWIKNLPSDDPIDGECTFPAEAIDSQIEIDYQLSQAGRGLKYSSDPTLLLKEPAMGEDGKIIKGAGNALVVSEKGDAKLLEIDGTASAAVIEYCRAVREMALETAHGNRTNADKLASAQSGRAMEMMNQALVNLADRLRISYGEGGLLVLIKMIVKASAKFELMCDGEKLGELNQKERISLRWPHWYAPTYADKQAESVTMGMLRDKQLISQETAVRTIAPSYDISDAQDELLKIKAEPPPASSTEPVKPKQEPLEEAAD